MLARQRGERVTGGALDLDQHAHLAVVVEVALTVPFGCWNRATRLSVIASPVLPDISLTTSPTVLSRNGAASSARAGVDADRRVLLGGDGELAGQRG